MAGPPHRDPPRGAHQPTISGPDRPARSSVGSLDDHVVDTLADRFPRIPRRTIARQIRRTIDTLGPTPGWAAALAAQQLVGEQLTYVEQLSSAPRRR